MIDHSKKYVIEFKDGDKMEVSSKFIELSTTYNNLLDDITDDDEDIVSLPCSEQWKKESYNELYTAYNTLINKQPDYFTKLSKNTNYSCPENRDLTETEVELKYSSEKYPIIFEMLAIANFLDMKTFIQLLAKIIANKINEARISDNDQDIINLLGNPDNVLTPEQQEFYDNKVEVLKTLKENQNVSI